MSYFGAYFGSSVACDYPAESDVAIGVVYANGTMTGVLDCTPNLEPDATTSSPADVARCLAIVANKVLDATPNSASAWMAYVNREPDSPDNVVTFYDVAGKPDGRNQPTGESMSHYGIQIRIRAATHDLGWAKANALRSWMSESVLRERITIGGVTYGIQCFTDISEVISLGKETPTTKRSVFTLNAKIAYRICS